MENFIHHAVVDLRVISKCNRILFQILLGVSSYISYLKRDKLRQLFTDEKAQGKHFLHMLQNSDSSKI